MSILVCNHLDGEERTDCFAWFVLLMSRDCCLTHPRGATNCLQFVIVVFPDHTHYFPIITTSKENTYCFESQSITTKPYNLLTRSRAKVNVL